MLLICDALNIEIIQLLGYMDTRSIEELLDSDARIKVFILDILDHGLDRALMNLRLSTLKLVQLDLAIDTA